MELDFCPIIWAKDVMCGLEKRASARTAMRFAGTMEANNVEEAIVLRVRRVASTRFGGLVEGLRFDRRGGKIFAACSGAMKDGPPDRIASARFQ